MCPSLFHNIYKGALGEVIGKYLFQRVLELDLKEIEDPEEFELFDYKLNDHIYIDLKHWRESTVFDDDEMLDKIEKKAIKCNAKCVIVANILAENEWPVHCERLNNLVILEVPSLLKIVNNSLEYNGDAWNEIRRCINEFSN